MSDYVASPYSNYSKFEEWESASGKINSRVANFITLSIDNQLTKFKYPNDTWVIWPNCMPSLIQPDVIRSLIFYMGPTCTHGTTVVQI